MVGVGTRERRKSEREKNSKRACATTSETSAGTKNDRKRRGSVREGERGLLRGGKEEMGHIKGSLGHGGWYLTQIHIFHSDGRGMVEGSGRVRIGCVWVVGLLEHVGGGWVARRGGTGRTEGERARALVRVRVYMCASVRARGMGGYSGG